MKFIKEPSSVYSIPRNPKHAPATCWCSDHDSKNHQCASGSLWVSYKLRWEWVSLLGNALHEFHGAFSTDSDDDIS